VLAEAKPRSYRDQHRHNSDPLFALAGFDNPIILQEIDPRWLSSTDCTRTIYNERVLDRMHL
jgi:hypothetical protein